jgi:hypothetical protein
MLSCVFTKQRRHYNAAWPREVRKGTSQCTLSHVTIELLVLGDVPQGTNPLVEISKWMIYSNSQVTCGRCGECILSKVLTPQSTSDTESLDTSTSRWAGVQMRWRLQGSTMTTSTTTLSGRSARTPVTIPPHPLTPSTCVCGGGLAVLQEKHTLHEVYELRT